MSGIRRLGVGHGEHVLGQRNLVDTGPVATIDQVRNVCNQDSGVDGIRPAEGSFATYHAPYYYLWFSHGQCCDLNANALPAAGHEYSIRVGRSMDPRGPYLDKDGTDLVNGGGTIVYASNDDVYAPGGEGVLNDGQNDILFYHYVNTTVGYGFNQTSMGWNFLDYPDGWPVATYNRPSTSSSSYYW